MATVDPKVGEAVVVAGLPGCEKHFPEPKGVDFGKMVFLAGVSSISDREISLVRAPSEEVIDTLEKGLPPRRYEMGGMSGGPMAAVLENAGILSWAISGVVSEAHQDYEIMKAARADFIDETGTINY